MMTPEADTLLTRARNAFEGRDYLAALADVRELADGHPRFADVRHLMGMCLSMLGQPEEALEQFERALAENDEYIDAHLARAITLNELGRFDEARASFERAAECESRAGGRFPASVSARLANAHGEVADLYLAAGAPGEAATELRRALGLRPEFHDLRNRLGEALMQLGELESARAEFERVLEGHEQFHLARLNLGLVHYRAGRREEARQAWEESRAQDPGDPRVRAYLHLIEAS
jgi:tetratricopeptide (TPR) repeat protein